MNNKQKQSTQVGTEVERCSSGDKAKIAGAKDGVSQVEFSDKAIVDSNGVEVEKSAEALRVEDGQGTECRGYFAPINDIVGQTQSKNADDNGSPASVVGCNANNANASARTVNCNNSLRNSNDNYCAASALICREETIMACASSANKTEGLRVGVSASSEYDLPPFCDGEIAETKAEDIRGLLAELDEVNSHKRLKNLKKFICHKYFISEALKKVLSGKDRLQKDEGNIKKGEFKSPDARYHDHHFNETVEKIHRDLMNETYRIGVHTPKHIPPRWKGGKHRNAQMLSVYDQTVQTTLLMVCEKKFYNKIPRNVYSNMKDRGIFCKNKTYCLSDQLSFYISNNKSHWVAITDIKKFYESLSSKYVYEAVCDVVVDKFARKLFKNIITSLPTMPLGDCLSPILANLTMSKIDRYILEHFKPKFFAAFGDNRIFGFPTKGECYELKDWLKTAYKETYNLELKNDWAIVPVKHEFSFCKTKYKPYYKHIRAKLRSHAIKYCHIPERFAGYKGFILKTDSKRLLWMIDNQKHTIKKSVIRRPKHVRRHKRKMKCIRKQKRNNKK